MPHAIRVHSFGGPDVLTWQQVDVPPPSSGEVRLRQTAIGVNFIDTYHRNGLYPLPNLPSGLGVEGVGVIEELGPGVSAPAIGTSVAYVGGPIGSYAEFRNYPADRLIQLPETIAPETAAAICLQGLTARFLVKETYSVLPGDAILVHAAAGGVGLLLCQWARHLGATVIGTVGSAAKADLARRHGCHHPILYREADFVDEVRSLTDGAGVRVVYDGVGKATFEKSLSCLAPRGLMVSFGQSSGKIDRLDIAILATKGSLFLTRPSLFTYIAAQGDLQTSAADLFNVLEQGVLSVHIGRTLPLQKAAEAHRLLESRASSGSIVLLPIAS